MTKSETHSQISRIKLQIDMILTKLVQMYILSLDGYDNQTINKGRSLDGKNNQMKRSI